MRTRRALLLTAAALTATGTAVIAGPQARMTAAAAPSTHVRGDFNGDGYADLAIGGADSVSIAYGGASGLSTAGTQRFDPSSPGLPAQLQPCSQPRPDISFGLDVAAGDFNGDGYADLAISVPDCWITAGSEASAIIVLWGSPAGLSTTNSAWLADAAVGGGESLAVGDFNHDGFDDLAAGAPYDTVNGNWGQGSVKTWNGGSSGMTPQSVFTENSPGMPGSTPAQSDIFGFSLASGDFNRDGYADLAISAPGRGATTVLRGGAAGLTTAKAQYLQTFGPYNNQAVAVGDFNGDGYADLAVGSPRVVHTAPNEGIVEVHYGSTRGLGSVGIRTAQEFWATMTGMPAASGGVPPFFGYSLTTGDFNHDGKTDLAVGAGGGFYVLYGSAKKLAVKNAQLITDGMIQQSMGAADFNADGYSDIAIGWPESGTTDSRVDIHLASNGRVGAVASVTFYDGTAGVTTTPPNSGEENGFGTALSPPGLVGGHNV